jgi:protein-S-isoprenylcysteine O-methyltransferase Ste14
MGHFQKTQKPRYVNSQGIGSRTDNRVKKWRKNFMARGNTLEVIGHVLFIGFYALLIAFVALFFGRAIFATLIYAGLISLGLGVTLLVSSSQSRNKGRISNKKKGGNDRLVENGMYAIVRHPEFLSHLLIIIGLVCITQRLVSLTIGVLMTILLWLAMRGEEKTDIEKFGHAYTDYMKKVPRINLLAGIARHRRRSTQ